MVLQNYQNLIDMTSNIFHIIAFGVGFKCPRKIHLNTQCPPPLQIGDSHRPPGHSSPLGSASPVRRWTGFRSGNSRNVVGQHILCPWLTFFFTLRGCRSSSKYYTSSLTAAAAVVRRLGGGSGGDGEARRRLPCGTIIICYFATERTFWGGFSTCNICSKYYQQEDLEQFK